MMRDSDLDFQYYDAAIQIIRPSRVFNVGGRTLTGTFDNTLPNTIRFTTIVGITISMIFDSYRFFPISSLQIALSVGGPRFCHMPEKSCRRYLLVDIGGKNGERKDMISASGIIVLSI